MKHRRTSIRIAAAIVGGAATIGLVPMLPAVGQQSPPVGGQSPARVEVCIRGRSVTVARRAADILVARGRATLPPCPGRGPRR